MTTAYILLGSNMGNRLQHLQDAGSLLARQGLEQQQDAASGLEIAGQSRIYESAAWGKIEQADYLNQAIQISTSLSPLSLLEVTSAIETRLGRIRKKIWEPRIIDIDILFYGTEVIREEKLLIPHPHLQDRRFVLVPLAEIASDLVHPVLKKSIRELLQACPDPLWVREYACC